MSVNAREVAVHVVSRNAAPVAAREIAVHVVASMQYVGVEEFGVLALSVAEISAAMQEFGVLALSRAEIPAAMQEFGVLALSSTSPVVPGFYVRNPSNDTWVPIVASWY